MIRECTETDREILGGYLEEDSYGQAIFHLIDEFGLNRNSSPFIWILKKNSAKVFFL